MTQRSRRSLDLARRRFHYSVRFTVPAGGLGVGLNDLHAFLSGRLGAGKYAIFDDHWDGALQAANILFDEPAAAGEIAAWFDQRCVAALSTARQTGGPPA